MARRLSYDEFRKNLASYLDEVSAGLLYIESGAGCAVLMSEHEFEGWKETVYLLQSPANAQQLLAGTKAADDGKLVEHEIIERGLKWT
jgi:antitoxin YefM